MEKYARDRIDTKHFALDQALQLLLEHTARRVRDGVRSAATLAMHVVHARWMADQVVPQGIFGGERVRLGDVALADLTTPALRALLEHWRTRGGVGGRELSLVTVAKRKATLRRAVAVAVEAGLLRRVPDMPQIGLPPLRPRVRVLKTYGELLQLKAGLDLRRWEWVSVAVWTAQRPGDIQRMRWCDVSLGSTPSMIIRSTKTRRPHGIRVTMPRHLVSILETRRNRLQADGKSPAPTDALVDPWPGAARVLPVVAVRLGLPPLRPLDLRHTALTWMVRRTGLTVAAQHWGGWCDFNMMQKFYAHALPPGLQQASDELASIADEAVAAP